jgi:hypothetical protein
MINLRIAIFAAVVAFGAYNHFHYETVCGGTANQALCQLSIDAGESDAVARNAGNGIYR